MGIGGMGIEMSGIWEWKGGIGLEMGMGWEWA